MNSERLRRYVLEELAFDPRADASGIGVTVENCVVALTGHVHSAVEKTVVVNAIKRLKGVRGIVVNIDILPTTELKMEDGEIAKRAAAVLAWHRSVPPDSITVTVKNGCATLSGLVDWQFQRLAAEDGILSLSGVTGISNEISIRSTSQKTDIRNAIEEAMHRLADVHASQINVAVDEIGHVKLEGRVVGWQTRNTVEDVAWMVPGVRNVDNRVRIC